MSKKRVSKTIVTFRRATVDQMRDAGIRGVLEISPRGFENETALYVWTDGNEAVLTDLADEYNNDVNAWARFIDLSSQTRNTVVNAIGRMRSDPADDWADLAKPHIERLADALRKAHGVDKVVMSYVEMDYYGLR